MPVFTFSNCGSWPSRPVTIAQFTTLEIGRKLGFYDTQMKARECAIRSMQGFWRLWKYDINHKEGDIPLLESFLNDENTKPSFLIKPYALDFGIYKVLHKITVMQYNRLTPNFRYCYIRLNTLPLVAQVKGGSERKVFKEFGITLEWNAYDPNSPRDDQGHLRIEWSCQFEEDPACQLVWMESNLPAHVIPPEYLIYNRTYNFTMEVRTDKYKFCALCSPVSPQYASVIIHIESKIKITSNQTELSIECLRNCGERVLADRELVLKLKFIFRTVMPPYSWMMIKNGGEVTPVGDKLNPRAAHILIIEENKLEEGARYTILAKDPWTEWSAAYSFEVDKFVYNSTCTVHPDSGEKGISLFDIKCPTPAGNFRFEFYDRTDEEAANGTDIGNGRMLGTSFTGYISTRITRGNVLVFAYNVYGSIASQTVTVQLTMKPYDDAVMKKIIYRELEERLKLEDARTTLGYISTIPDLLPADVDKTEIAKAIFKAFESVDVSHSGTLEMIKLWTSTVSNVLRSLTKPKPVAVEVATWSRMMSIMHRLALALRDGVEKQEEHGRWITPSQVRTLSRNLLSCVILLLDTKDEQFIEVDEESTDLTTLYQLRLGSNSAKDTVDTVKAALSLDQAPGEPPTKLESANGDITLWIMGNDEIYTIRDMLESEKEIPVSIPKNLLTDLEQTISQHEELSLQVAVFNQNIFWWNKSGVKSTLTSVVIGRRGASKRMTGIGIVDTPLRVAVGYNSAVVDSVEINGTVKLGRQSDMDLAVRVHRLDVPPRSLVRITFRFASPDSLRVLISLKQRPDYDSINGSGIVITGNETRSWEFPIPDELTFLYLGVLPGPDVPADTEVSYSFDSDTKVCQTWANSHWTSSGCWITSRDQNKNDAHCGGEGTVCCDCTHFSIFAAVFPVPPEEIDPFADAKLFLTVLDNPLVIVFVSCLLLLYVILCLIMWRKDRHDEIFRHVLVLDDNYPLDRYPYLLSVHTGSRFSSGTTAQVGVKVNGEYANSRAHLLSSSERQVLQRNSDDWFVIFCPERLGKLTSLHVWHDNTGSSPEWYCEQVVVYDLERGLETRFYVQEWLALRENCFPEAKALTANMREVENMKRTFVDNFVLGMWESHMFISVIFRHPRSEITRAQRLGTLMCCIMVALLCSIMFYRSSSSTSSDPISDDYNYNITQREFYVSVQSLIMSLLITMLVFFLFRMSYRYVHRPRRSTLIVRNSDDVDYLYEVRKESFLKEVTSTHSNKEGHSLYKNFVRLTSKMITTHPMTPIQTQNCESVVKRRTGWYIAAWVVCLFVIASSAYLVMLYGLKLGHVQSLKWLTSILLTMGEEVVVSGPARILMGAIILSMAYRRMFDVDTHRVTANKVLMLLPQNTDDYVKQLIIKRSAQTYRPLGEAITEKMLHKYRVKARWWKLTDFTLAVCFLVVLHNVIFSLWSSHYYSNSNVCRVIGHPHLPTFGGVPFDEVTNISTMESYLSHTFVHTVFNLRWYNNDLIGEGDANTKYWAGDYVHRMIGQPVARQKRIIPELCENLVGLTGHCVPPSSRAVRDTDLYEYGWAKARHHAGSGDKYFPWKFTEPSSSRGVTAYRLTGPSGRVYDNGGYQTTLGATRIDAENKANDLAAAHWQTTRTRALFLELTLYNVNENMFSQVTLIVEYLLTGVTLIRAKSTSIEYDLNYNIWHLAFIVFILYYVVTGSYFINRQGMLEHLSKLGGFCRLCVVVLGSVTIGLFFAHYFVSMRFVKKFQREGKESYFDFDHFSIFIGRVKVILSALLCFAILRAFLLIRLGRRFLSGYYMFVISRKWVCWLSLVALLTFYIVYLISVLLVISVPGGLKSGVKVPKRDRLDERQCLVSKRYLVFKYFIFNIFITLFIVMFVHHSRVAKTYKIRATDSFNYFAFLLAQLKRKRHKT